MNNVDYRQKQMNHVKYMKEVDPNYHRVLSREEEQSLFRQYKEEGCMESRDKLFTHNERLAWALAEKHLKKTQGQVPLEDLHQDARVILLDLIDKHDYTLGNKFSTYFTNSAYRLMERSTRSFLYQGQISTRIGNYLNRIKAIKDALHRQLGRDPMEHEFLSCPQMKDLLSRKSTNGQSLVTKEEALLAFRIEAGYLSLDLPITNSQELGPTIGDLWAIHDSGGDVRFDLDSFQAQGEFSDPTKLAEINQASDYYCSFLNKKQSTVFKKYMMAQQSSSSVAKELGISRQRVTQLKQEVIDILKDIIER